MDGGDKVVADGRINTFPNSEIISTKKFIAYDVQQNWMVLCEKTESEQYVFWLFDLQSESLTYYNNIQELASVSEIDEICWEGRWVDLEVTGDSEKLTQGTQGDGSIVLTIKS